MSCMNFAGRFRCTDHNFWVLSAVSNLQQAAVPEVYVIYVERYVGHALA